MRSLRLLSAYFFFPLCILSQNWKLSFSVKAEENGTGCIGAEVSFIKNNSLVEKKITANDGRCKFPLEPNADYRIEITKPGYVKKLFAVNTKGVPNEELADFGQIDITVVLFEPLADCDVSALNKPLLRYAYDHSKKYFDYSNDEYDFSQELLAQIKTCEQKAEANAKKFIKLMVEGKNALTKKDCKNASIKFTQALELKPKSEEALKFIKEADDLCAGHAKLDLDYKNAMAAGLSAKESGQLEKSLTEYEKAQSLKPMEKEPSKKIEEIKNLIKQSKNETEFNKVLNEGRLAFEKHEYEKALDILKKAKSLNGSHPEPPRLIAEINVLLSKSSSYDAAIKNALEKQSEKNWEKAIKFYNEALTYKQNDTVAKRKIQECNNELSKLNSDIEKQNKYLASIKNGRNNLEKKNWDEAILNFQEALSIKPNDADALSGLKEADDGKRKSIEVNRNETMYYVAMKNGERVLSENGYDSAIVYFSEALSYKRQDVQAEKKLDMAKELLSKFNTEKGLEERYKSSMGKGEEAMKSKKWVEAIENFKEALQIKKEDVVAEGKIKEAEEGRKLEESGKKSDELFKIAIKNGDEAMLKKKWNEAIADYGEALKIKQNDQLALVKLEKAKSGKLNQERFEDYFNEGKKFLLERKWDDAIVSLNKAIEIIPDDPELNKKLQEAQSGKKKEEEKNKFLYDEAMSYGRQSLAVQKFNEAITAFSNALTYKKDDPEATKKIEEARVGLKNQASNKETNARFNDALFQADLAIRDKKYEQAMSKYLEAKNLKPESNEVEIKIQNLKQLMDKVKRETEVEESYRVAMKEGEEAELKREWERAITVFENKALKIKPGDKLALSKIEDCKRSLKDKRFADSVLLKEKNEMEKFSKVLADARNSLNKKDYKTALIKYKEANALKKNESEPLNKISEIEAILKKMEIDEKLKEEQRRNDQLFYELMLAGKKMVTEKKYDVAREKFIQAQVLKPGEPTPAAEIKKLDDLVRLQSGNSANSSELNYKITMANGEKEYSAKNYSKALQFYKEALNIKPNDSMAQKRISETEQLLKNSASSKENPLNEKYASLPQGITGMPRVYTRDYVSTVSVVKRGDMIMVLEKKEFAWGAIHYLNDQVISSSEYAAKLKD